MKYVGLIVFLESVLFLLVIGSANGNTGILEHPASVNISYGETANFSCVVSVVNGGQAYWLINSTLTSNRATLDRNGYFSVTESTSPNRKTTLFVNGSFYANNNLEVSCGVLDHVSKKAELKILGLHTFLNLTVVMRTEHVVKVSWRKPFLFIDAHEYMIVVSNKATLSQKNVTVAGNESHYLFAPGSNKDYCSWLEICVKSVLLPSNKVEGVSGCVTTSFKRGKVLTSSVENAGSTTVINCNVTCSQSSVVTWLANGKPLQYFSQLSFSANDNSRSTSCSQESRTSFEEELTYVEQLEVGLIEEKLTEDVGFVSLEFQCVSISSCGSDLEDCAPSVCHGPLVELNITLEVELPSRTGDVATASVLTVPETNTINHKPRWSDYGEAKAILGVAIAFAAVLVAASVICVGVICHKLKRSQYRENNIECLTRNPRPPCDPVYETCAGLAKKNECFYDQPNCPSPLPSMQPCEAYSTLPVT